MDVSIVVPVYNEAENLPLLFSRLTDTLDKEAILYEVIFTNDGSQDASLDLLKTFYKSRILSVLLIFMEISASIWLLWPDLRKPKGRLSSH